MDEKTTGKTAYCGGRDQKNIERQAEIKKKTEALKQERMQRNQGIIVPIGLFVTKGNINKF